MYTIPKKLETAYGEALAGRKVSVQQRGQFFKWLRYYLDFCRKHGHRFKDPDNLQLFMLKLSEKGQGSVQQSQATKALGVYFSLVKERTVADEGDRLLADDWDSIFELLKKRIQTLHYSKNTLKTYALWAQQFRAYLLREKVAAPASAKEAAAFFTYLASERKVAASTQNQAFNALLFLFKNVLEREFEGFEGVVRAKASNYIPTVLSRREIDLVVSELAQPYDLIVKLQFGCGLRLFESVNIRLNWIDVDAGMLTVHDGKGKKDRSVPLPKSLSQELSQQIERVKRLHLADLARGFDGVFMPVGASKKFRAAAKDLPWQWLFPARNLTLVPEDGEHRRYHAHETKVSDAIRKAARRAQLTKRVTAHAFRHSFASHLLQNNFDIRTIQQLLGHSSIKTTMRYTHTAPVSTVKEPMSPLDL